MFKVYLALCTSFLFFWKMGDKSLHTLEWIGNYRRTSERKSLFSMCLKLNSSSLLFTHSYIYDVLYELSGKFMTVWGWGKVLAEDFSHSALTLTRS